MNSSVGILVVVDCYELFDLILRVYDYGVGEFCVDGEFCGYFVSVVVEIKLFECLLWFWFVKVWFDGIKELLEEDYGLGWYIVCEFDVGYFDDFELSILMEC